MIGITGSLAFDYILSFPGKFKDHVLPEKLHQINISFIVDKFTKRYGGTAGNIAYSLSLLGVPSAIYSAVGNDFSSYKKWLKKNKIEIKYLKTISKENSALGFVMTDQVDNQIWGYCYGALRHTANLLLPLKPKPSFLVISANYPKAFLSFTDQAIKTKIPYMYDFGMMLTALKKRQLIKGVTHAQIVIGNDYEICRLLKITGLTQKQILKKRALLITTFGSKGSEILTAEKKWRIPPIYVEQIIDPTGAGDAFRAGFLAGYLKNFNLGICGRMGSVCAAYAVEKIGTQKHHFTLNQFLSRYEDNFKRRLIL